MKKMQVMGRNVRSLTYHSGVHPLRHSSDFSWFIGTDKIIGAVVIR